LTPSSFAMHHDIRFQNVRLAAGLPVAIVMAGGYGRDIADTVDIHFQTVQLAAASQ
jgi:hypothetical protein